MIKQCEFLFVVLLSLSVACNNNVLTKDDDIKLKAAAITEANDGIDNDGDGLIDWQYDLGCTDKNDLTEGGLPTGALENGWTIFEPTADIKIFYVSSSTGNDSNDGLSPIQNGPSGPKRTLSAGLALLREGAGDWLLLRRGDSWDENVKVKTGSSLTKPTLISAYGDDPKPPTVRALEGRVSHAAVAHIRFIGGDNGMGGENIWIEGCQFYQHSLTIGVNAPSRNVKIARNTMENAGFYFTNINGLLARENVIYKPWGLHGMYITRGGNKNITTRGNLILKIFEPGVGNSNGIMQRSGGISQGNVVAGIGADAINMGACNDTDPSNPCVPGLVHARVRDNLVLDGVNGRGGIRIAGSEFIAPGAKVTGNILINAPLSIGKGSNHSLERNIIYNAPLSFAQYTGLTLLKNTFYTTQDRILVYSDDMPLSTGLVADGNKYFSTSAPTGRWFTTPNEVNFPGWVIKTGETGTGNAFTFKDPNRTIATYYKSLPGGIEDRDAFFFAALNQVKFNYRKDLTASAVITYFRKGFVINP